MGKSLNITIPVGLGDTILIYAMLDRVKHQYDNITLSFYREYINAYRGGDQGNHKFLNDIGKLLFSERPYHFLTEGHAGPLKNAQEIQDFYAITMTHPDLAHIICDPFYYHGLSNYIVINTKVRALNKPVYDAIKNQFWTIMRQISAKKKIVILGERVVEQNYEYKYFGSIHIWSLYDEIINNIPTNQILDMTVPALGITPPDLQHIRDDSCILRDADFVINIGIGGSFCLSAAVAKYLITYRADTEQVCEYLYGNGTCNHPRALITKDPGVFLNKLAEKI
jgi:hypothetical protein